jgi:hypothetical protein
MIKIYIIEFFSAKLKKEHQIDSVFQENFLGRIEKKPE